MLGLNELRSILGHGERAGSATAVQLTATSTPCQLVYLKALNSNAGNVYYGTSASITVAAGTTDATSGMELRPGDLSVPITVDNLNKIYFICDNATDDYTFIYY